jgi:hypothetical protein
MALCCNPVGGHQCFRLYLEDEGGMFLQDAGTHLPENITVSKPEYHNMNIIVFFKSMT